MICIALKVLQEGESGRVDEDILYARWAAEKG